MVRLFIYLTGFGLAVLGGVTSVAYLNIITAGKGIIEYFLFISKRIECYLLPIGIGLICLSIYFPSNEES